MKTGWKFVLGVVLGLSAMGSFVLRAAAAVTTTTVQGTVYRADGSAATGSLIVSWPAFSTATSQAVAAGSVTVEIGRDGFVSLNLTPNAGAYPAGTYYTAVYHLSDGTVSKEYWVVPTASPASIAAVRAQLAPATVAIQTVTKQYVDSVLSTAGNGSIPVTGGAMTGPLLLSGDPTSDSQAATKHYADAIASAAMPLTGGAFTGTVTAPLLCSPSALSYNVLCYGADPTGATDSSAAINAAIAASGGANVKIRIPAGNYLLKAPLVISGAANQGSTFATGPKLEGDGKGVTKLWPCFSSNSYLGTVTSVGATVTLAGGANFSQLTAGQNIFVAGIQYPVQSVISPTQLVLGLGTVNTNGTAVKANTAGQFAGMAAGETVYISDVPYTIQTYIDSSNMVLATSAGTQTGAAWNWNAIGNLTNAVWGLSNFYVAGSALVLDGNMLAGTVSVQPNGVVLWMSGQKFLASLRNTIISIGGTYYTIASVQSNTQLTLTQQPAVTPNPVAYFIDEPYNFYQGGYLRGFTLDGTGAYQAGNASCPGPSVAGASLSNANNGLNGIGINGWYNGLIEDVQVQHMGLDGITPQWRHDFFASCNVSNGQGPDCFSVAILSIRQSYLQFNGGWGFDSPGGDILTYSGIENSVVTGNGAGGVLENGWNNYVIGNSISTNGCSGGDYLVNGQCPAPTQQPGYPTAMSGGGLYVPRMAPDPSQPTAMHGAMNLHVERNEFDSDYAYGIWVQSCDDCYFSQNRMLAHKSAWPTGTQGDYPAAQFVFGYGPQCLTCSGGKSGYIVRTANSVNNLQRGESGVSLSPASALQTGTVTAIAGTTLTLSGSTSTMALNMPFNLSATAGGPTTLYYIQSLPSASQVILSSAPNGTPLTPVTVVGANYGYSLDYEQALYVVDPGMAATQLNISMDTTFGSNPGNFVVAAQGAGAKAACTATGGLVTGCVIQAPGWYPPLSQNGSGTGTATSVGNVVTLSTGAWPSSLSPGSPVWLNGLLYNVLSYDGPAQIHVTQAPNPALAGASWQYSAVAVPTVSFAGGNCTTQPAGFAQMGEWGYGLQWGWVQGVYLTNPGTGCTSNPWPIFGFSMLPPVNNVGMYAHDFQPSTAQNPLNSPMAVQTQPAQQSMCFGNLTSNTGTTQYACLQQNAQNPPQVTLTNGSASSGYTLPLQGYAGSNFSTTTSGLVPQPGTSTGRVLTDSGTWSGSFAQTGTANAFTLPQTMADVIAGGPLVDVRKWGAVADGATDNCTALTNAANAAGGFVIGVLWIPPVGTFQTSCALTLPATVSLQVDGVLQAKSAMAALVQTGYGSSYTWWSRRSIYGHGRIDANGLATTAVWLRQYRQPTIEDLNIYGIAAGGSGIRLGDSSGSGAYTGSYGASISSVTWAEHSSTGAAGSICIWADNGTDSKVMHTDPHGCAIGVQDNVGGSRYTGLHAWDVNMTVCFDDYSVGTFWTADQCDTPTTYGWHIRNLNTHIISSRAYLNGGYGVNNGPTAFYFDQTDPQVVLIDAQVTGADATHNWAADTNVQTNHLILDTVIGLEYTNVTNKNFGRGLLTVQTESAQIGILNGGYYENQVTVAGGATPAFNLNTGTVQLLTLSANVTGATVTGPAGGYEKVDFHICQPGTGGPFTFAWPAGTVGGGTVGATAGKCSLQMMEWNGTMLRSLSPMQVNE